VATHELTSIRVDATYAAVRALLSRGAWRPLVDALCAFHGAYLASRARAAVERLPASIHVCAANVVLRAKRCPKAGDCKGREPWFKVGLH
jgi:hypothetical protein